MIEAVCPVCHLTWPMFTGRHAHERQKYGRVVRIVTMRSQMCPSCQKKVDESKIRLIEGERGVV